MAIRSEAQIEQHVYDVLKPYMEKTIRGQLYKSEMRPTTSLDEDAVIKVLRAGAEQIADSRVRVNIYIPDKDNGNVSLVPDKERITTLSDTAEEIEALLNGADTDFQFSLLTAPMVDNAEGKNEHVVQIVFKIKIVTFNS